MAVGNNENNTLYLSVRKGKLCQTVPDNTPKALNRLDKDNKPTKYWELRYEWVDGILIDVIKKETEHEGQLIKSFRVLMVDEGHNLVSIEMLFNSPYASRFFSALQNLNPFEKFKISVWMFEDKETPGKMIQGCTLYQDGDKVPLFYTKENPRDLPPFEKIVRDGKEVLDSTAQMDFHYAHFLQYIKPELRDPRPKDNGANTQGPRTTEPTHVNAQGVPIAIEAADTDDLPF